MTVTLEKRWAAAMILGGGAAVALGLQSAAAGEMGLVPVVLAGAWLAVFRRAAPRWMRRLILVACPLVSAPIYAAVGTSLCFAGGTARLPSHPGLPHPIEGANLHRRYRVAASAESCRLEPLREVQRAIPRWVHRKTFEALFDIFGPMPGSYIGPYPDKQDAIAAIRTHATVVSGSDWARGLFTLNGRAVRVPVGVNKWAFSPTDTPVRIAIVDETCLLVHEETDHYDYVRLIDLEGFGQFATYRY